MVTRGTFFSECCVCIDTVSHSAYTTVQLFRLVCYITLTIDPHTNVVSMISISTTITRKPNGQGQYEISLQNVGGTDYVFYRIMSFILV